ncbi:MAG: T9SS C-terminal target domain-containing protein [Balneolaceae bacterium]|nr:MAG: T9SS C-terminal target domain-containing protein [Balneolaceae bacterium]
MGTGDGGDSAAGTNTSAHTGTNNSKNGYALIVDADGQSSSPDYTFPQIDEGKMLEIDIMTASGEKLNILGVSYTYNIISGGDQAVEVRNAIPGSWARDGFHPNTMLRFQKKEDGNIAGAVVHKGMVHTDLTGHMLLLRIAASESWDGPLTLGDFRFSYIDAEGNINRIDQVKVDFRVVTATGLPGQPDLPQKIQLYQNYPNPFNPETRIRFDLPEAADVRLDVFTITGQHVATLADEFRPAGHHNITFDAARMSSGVYMYRLKAGSVIQTRKMTLIK